MLSPLDQVVSQQKAGRPRGITSVCSAQPLVIEAAVAQALETGDHVLVEATSNQVDQYGGYTGMRPADFRDLVAGPGDRPRPDPAAGQPRGPGHPAAAAQRPPFESVRARRRGELAAEPRDLAVDRVRDVLRDHAKACTPQENV